MEIRAGHEEIAQPWRFERGDIVLLLGNEEAPEHRQIAGDGRNVDIRQFPLRQLALGLLRQRADIMPKDADADIVKIVIHEEGRVSLIIRQSVAELATGFGIEQFPTAFGEVIDGVCLSGDEMIEGQIE